MEHAARSCGVEENVLFYGAMGQAQLSGLLSQSHIGLLSSRSEGMPNSVMEYMHAGLPVVGTDIPGMREVLGDGCDGVLFPVGDAEKLAKIVESLANQSELRLDIGRRNRCRVEKVFSQSVIMPQWLDVLGLTPSEIS